MPEIRPSHVVGEDDDDVGRRRAGLAGGGCEGAAQREEEADETNDCAGHGRGQVVRRENSSAMSREKPGRSGEVRTPPSAA